MKLKKGTLVCSQWWVPESKPAYPNFQFHPADSAFVEFSCGDIIQQMILGSIQSPSSIIILTFQKKIKKIKKIKNHHSVGRSSEDRGRVPRTVLFFNIRRWGANELIWTHLHELMNVLEVLLNIDPRRQVNSNFSAKGITTWRRVVISNRGACNCIKCSDRGALAIIEADLYGVHDQFK